MNRHALLIDASEAKDHERIDGCKRDVERLEDWLRSEAGGAWESSEITVLHNPKKFDLLLPKIKIDNAYFAFSSFSGHGRIVQEPSGRQTQKIVIGTGEEVDLSEITPKAKKGIVCCDACREVHIMKEKHFRFAEGMIKMSTAAPNRASYRQMFETAVTAAGEGIYTMYSCSPNECAGDDALNGGVFTDALLSSASDWFSGSKRGILTINAAFETAARIVGTGGKQTPMATASIRSGNAPPFGISL